MASNAHPLVRSGDDIQYEPVHAASGLEKGVVLGAAHGAPHFALRRFILAPHATVPKHTNDIEHVQYVLEGEYTVGIDDAEYAVTAGDSVLIPADTVHWYRNDSDESGAFLCAVPHGDDEINLVE